jgi:phosphate transport system protein
MTREKLDRILHGLMEDVVLLESMVRQAMLDSVGALIRRDFVISRRVYENDVLVNEKRFEIERDCIATIAMHQPMAKDIRLLASVLELSTELERIGDYAKGIARINFMIEEDELPAPIHLLPRMTEIAAEMLTRSVRAFVQQDIEEARAIPATDDQVDEMHNQITAGLVDAMVRQPDLAGVANHLQWAVHNVERMADRVTNICERTNYVVTGALYEFENSDDEIRHKAL